MGWVEEADWQNAATFSLSDEENIYQEVISLVPTGMRLLGIDCYGFDVEHSGKRARHQFADAPIHLAKLADVIKRFLISL
ncbi:MAG: pyridoxamine 5-phosphate oxidase [Herminiimonas sp.]|nr:pyridoxamine 5-phosphate oxidase [Herminiimonas sp.]